MRTTQGDEKKKSKMKGKNERWDDIVIALTETIADYAADLMEFEMTRGSHRSDISHLQQN